MKKLLILLLFAGTICACNNHKPTQNKNFNIPSDADDDKNGAATEKLVLNNGVKWKVDTNTNDNAAAISAILKKFDSGNYKSIIAYKNAQNDLQAGINNMIAECKIKGPDHIALHKWLKPLIAKVSALEKAHTVTDAAEAVKTIETQVNLYNQYFEL